MAFQVECKCGKILTLHNKMKGKKFNCPHCKLVISLKTKSKPKSATAGEPNRKPNNADAPTIALKDDSGSIPIPVPERGKPERKTPPPKKIVFDEVEVVDDSNPVMLEIDVDSYDDDSFDLQPMQPTPPIAPAYSPAHRPIRHEGMETGKVVFFTGLVAFSIVFVGIVVWLIYLFFVNIPDIDMSLAENDRAREGFFETEEERQRRARAVLERDRNRRERYSEFQKSLDEISRSGEDFSRRMEENRKKRERERRRRNTEIQKEFDRKERERKRKSDDFRKQQKKEEDQTKADIKRVFSDYQHAVATRAGEKVASLLSKDSLAKFGMYRKHALSSDMKTVRKLTELDQTMVLAMRVRFTAEELEPLSPQSCCARYFSRGAVEILDEGYRGMNLGKLLVLDETASALESRIPNRKSVPSIHFKYESDEWKIELYNQFNMSESYLESALIEARNQSRVKITVEAFIVNVAKANATNRLSKNIWRPMLSQRNRSR